MGNKINYSSYAETEITLDLRDRLAVERTALANKRTYLAVVRTSLTIAVLAFSLLKFFPGSSYSTISFILLAIAGITLMMGTKQYFDTKSSLVQIEAPDNDQPSLISWLNENVTLFLSKLHFVHLKIK